MKRITGLHVPPDGLARFIADPAMTKTWDEFGSFEAGAARRELTAALVDQQHGLCAYCEIALISDDTRVEHFIPQSDLAHGAALALDHSNLMAVCMGGSNANFGPNVRKPDRARYLPPVRMNLSCDAAKGNRPASAFIDPRMAPALPSLFHVDEDGVLSTDVSSCASHAVPEETVEQHIIGLRLNVGRLRNQREAVRAALTDTYKVFATLPPEEMRERLIAFAERQLLPDAGNTLAPFFTTTRSFFGPLAERILEQPPHVWT